MGISLGFGMLCGFGMMRTMSRSVGMAQSISHAQGGVCAIKDTILEDMKAAMRAKDKTTLSTLRLVRAEIEKGEKREGEYSDADVLSTLRKIGAQRSEAAAAYEAAGRAESAQAELAEKAIIDAYLPAQMSNDDMVAHVDAAIADTGASSPKQMGAVMAALRPLLADGTVDGKALSALVKSKLQ